MIPWVTSRNRTSKILCKELYPESDFLTNLRFSHKHSSYSSSFPIYLFTQKEREVVDEDAEFNAEKKDEFLAPEETNEDEAVVEEVLEDGDENPPTPKMKKVIIDEWEQLNAQPPIWTRCVGLLASVGLFFNCL